MAIAALGTVRPELQAQRQLRRQAELLSSKDVDTITGKIELTPSYTFPTFKKTYSLSLDNQETPIGMPMWIVTAEQAAELNQGSTYRFFYTGAMIHSVEVPAILDTGSAGQQT